MRRGWLILIGLMLLAAPTLAQRFITEDDVTRVAQRLYCPVCENIPLDDCGMEACIIWKQEIAEMLAAGMSDEQIIANFVARYGEKVAGVPLDDTLRMMAFIMPLLGLLLASIAAALTFTNWEKRKQSPEAAPQPAAAPDDYRQQFERDV
ncbi:MAG: cytochrome c-type biogenesis protein CcmH [Anaerolineae bacterium]